MAEIDFSTENVEGRGMITKEGFWLVRFDVGRADHSGSTSPLMFAAAIESARQMISAGQRVTCIEPAPEFDDSLEYCPPPLPSQRTYDEREVAILCGQSGAQH